MLAHRGFHRPTGVHRYTARPNDCQACSLRKQCTGGRHRGLCRMEDEDARDLARAEMRHVMYKRPIRLRSTDESRGGEEGCSTIRRRWSAEPTNKKKEKI